MNNIVFKGLFSRDLKKLMLELEAYKEESRIWRIDKSITNSAGNLTLHIIGNLNAYIGNGLAKAEYVRDRSAEFSMKDVPLTILKDQIIETEKMVQLGLESINHENMDEIFPILIWEQPRSIAFTLIHLYGHLNYHLGQVNYHRRLLDN